MTSDNSAARMVPSDLDVSSSAFTWAVFKVDRTSATPRLTLCDPVAFWSSYMASVMSAGSAKAPVDESNRWSSLWSDTAGTASSLLKPRRFNC